MQRRVLFSRNDVLPRLWSPPRQTPVTLALVETCVSLLSGVPVYIGVFLHSGGFQVHETLVSRGGKACHMGFGDGLWISFSRHKPWMLLTIY